VKVTETLIKARDTDQGVDRLNLPLEDEGVILRSVKILVSVS
jgi:hypothetical protein